MVISRPVPLPRCGQHQRRLKLVMTRASEACSTVVLQFPEHMITPMVYFANKSLTISSTSPSPIFLTPKTSLSSFPS
jgi:hypothetical protein